MAAEITMSTAVLVVAVMLLLSGAGAGAAPQIGMPNCDTSCGGVEVPYPFGIGPDATCYLPGFNLTCDRSRDPPRLLLGTGAGADEILVDYISIGDASFLKVFHTVGKLDAAKTSAPLLGGALSWPDGPYILPTTGTGNELVLTGCNVQATLIKNGNVTVSGCLSFCPEQGEEEEEPLPDVGEECPGIGCCRAPTVAGHDAVSYGMKLDGFGSHAAVDRERVPVRAFIAVVGWFDYWLSKSPRPSMDVFAVPVYLHWEMGASSSKPQRCSSSSNAGCRSNHSICVNATRGYRCQCAHGYQGNPYIPDACKADACDDMVCYGECIQDMDGKPVCQCGLGTQGNAMVSGGCVRPVVGVSDKGKCRMMSCGGVDVPYPFGIQDMSPSDCYHEGFNLTCDTTHDPPQLILGDGTIRVTEIHVENATMHTIYTGDPIVNASYYNNELTNFELIGMSSQAGHPVHYSLATSNELILTGCNTHATLHGDPDIVSGCASFCPSNFTATDAYSKVRGSLPRRRGGGGKGKGKYCHGMGCCQAPISQSTNGEVPRILDFGWLFAQSVFEDSTPPPTFVFIAMEGWFDRLGFSGKLGAYQQPPPGEIKNIPIVLQWEVSSAKHNCTTSSNICKSKHSYCKQSRKRGYTCHCKEGYPGNPYDDHDGGCKGDHHKPVIIGISIGVGLASAAGLIVSILIGRCISKKVKQQRALMLKQKFFEQNRGQLLQQLVSQRADIAEKMIIPLEELEKATHNFDEDHVLGRGGHGTVYKGMLSDLHVVAIKKPKKVLQREIDEFINEVAILSQINHRNVVKLYGCCLETEVPMLVYEFIANGTLYEHLHTDEPRSLSWNDRLRIATETAKSLAYLHSTASIPIIHRDVKSANILLDDTLTAKVADFGASRYIAVDKSGLTTMVQGTIGYLDPMYFYTGRLIEKSDVYSYGVMLVELLTRKKPFQYLSPEGEGLVAHFVTLCTEGNLSDILDPQLIDEGDKEIDEAIALAVACIKLKGEDRPTMRLVELTLEGLRPSKKHNLHDVGVNKLDKNGIRINSRSIRGGSGSETST